MEDVLGLGGRRHHALSSAAALQMLVPSRCVPIKMWAGGFPSPQLFLHHLWPLCLGGVWGGLGLFTGVFLPLVELGHSGRRAGVSVGWMGTHCAAPRVKKLSLREMMEIKIKRTEPMSGWTDI